MEDLTTLSGIELAKGMKVGKLDSGTVYSSFREKIRKMDPALKSFVEAYDDPIKESGDSPLAGVPIAIKDNICIEGRKITCASRILDKHVSVYDATVIRRLKEAGLARLK